MRSRPRRAATLISTVQAPTDSSPSSVKPRVSSLDAARGPYPPYHFSPSTAHIEPAVLKRRSTFDRPTTPIGKSLSWGVNTRSTCRSRCVITFSETADGLWTPLPKSSHLQFSSWLSQLATSSVSSRQSNGRSFIAVPISLPARAVHRCASLIRTVRAATRCANLATVAVDRHPFEVWLLRNKTRREDAEEGTNLHQSARARRTDL